MRKYGVLPALLALIVTSLAHAQGQKWTEGTNYFLIEPAQHTNVPAGKIEVVEVFSYACPWCAQFNPLVDQLRKSLPANAQMVYLPASFIPAEDWPMFQRATCTAQTLGIFDKTHDAMFDAVWKTGELAVSDPKTHALKNPLPTIEDAARYYNRISGIPVDKFLAASKSFSVDVQMRRDDALVKAYQVDGTPSLVVNGKYRITGQSAGGMPQMIEIAKFLVQKEQKTASARPVSHHRTG
ncbi:MAG: thiol:disulfide interchange protein DsbA/DsbL [Sinobacteraceae bacterium]|nr:thiol:disulfide interchange protein DsbA/DsbL [Nevskiaceae bacterium]